MKHLIFPFICLALVACNSSTEQAPVDSSKAHIDYLSGLASPIRMAPDSTVVHLNDYIQRGDLLDAVIFEGDTLQVNKGRMQVTLNQQPTSAISMLELIVQGVRHAIPVFKTEKVNYNFTYSTRANHSSVAIAGNMNGWNASATPLVLKNGQWVAKLALNPGEYQYQIVADGVWMLDDSAVEKVSNGQGGFNSTFTVWNPDVIAPTVLTGEVLLGKIPVQASTEGTLHMWWENTYLGKMNISPLADTIWTIAPPKGSEQLENSTLRAWIEHDGLRGNDLHIPLKKGKPVTSPSELARTDPHKWIMYFLMVDRFFDGDSTNNMPVNDPGIQPIANHLGGDLAGVTKQLNANYFKALGMNTIWVSPITTNADGAWGLWDKGTTSTFSGYHGYWPVSSSEVDPHFGNEATFKTLIDEVHSADMNIIVDYVANHVHENHPVYQQHKDWATPLYLPDGRMNTELWDEERLTTWFDTFLPTLDLENPVVAEAMTDSALFWLHNYDIDGFRHDATKHIPESFWRMLTLKAKNRILNPDGKNENERKAFQIGETYGNPELISSYVSSGMLDGQFDFNLYDACVDAFAKDATGFSNLKRVLEESMHYYGSHHLMGNITGNQDRVRFTSYADGGVDFSEDGKLAGWTREINNQGAKGYERMLLLQAFIMTIPGIPCVYYGDEIAMAGGNDPDNRRMMEFANLNSDQLKLRNTVSALTKLRTNRMSLVYGDVVIKEASKDLFAFERTYLGERTLVLIHKGAPRQLAIADFTQKINDIFIIENAVIAQDTLFLGDNSVVVLGTH
jgi:cyclomaltodextrinase